MKQPTDKQYFGKVCPSHPELNGLRQKASSTCVECGRLKCLERARLRGVKPRAEKLAEHVAKERIKERERVRSQKRRENPEYNKKQIERKREWRANNLDRHRATNRAYDAKQLKENLQRKLSKNLRHRIYKAMTGKTRGVSAVKDLCMSIEEFKLYISEKFTSGMSWENYGEWHLDHIRPLISFDLTDIEQAKMAVHYSNYQPLWAKDNISKSGKWIQADEATK